MIVLHDTLWWPKADVSARRAILRDLDKSLPALLAHTEGRSCAVQAGANVGVYPIALADHFRSVVTVEPDPLNYECLVRNLQALDTLKRVTALNAAFGERAGYCDPIEVEAGNCGAHRVDFSGTGVQVVAIDAVQIRACDLIALDIEGAELLALKGARETIERFSPTICIEDKGLSRTYGVPIGAAQEWLAGLGYAEVAEICRDKVFRRINR